MGKIIYDVTTTTDVQMSIQEVETFVDEQKQENEICFFIHGHSPSSDSDLEETVTISKQEAKRLIKMLEFLSM